MGGALEGEIRLGERRSGPERTAGDDGLLRPGPRVRERIVEGCVVDRPESVLELADLPHEVGELSGLQRAGVVERPRIAAVERQMLLDDSRAERHRGEDDMPADV